ncbi:MAG: hypothetical protein HY904_24315 [Deltaproteobacteria bacterium]|nr:hypothetical protein [Deltaproteobacteria bacterium]
MVTARVLRSPHEMDGQLSGFWVGPGDDLRVRPTYGPTGAILPRPGAPVLGEFLCLDLVTVDEFWCPLSEAGQYTYAHSSGLLRGQPWRFFRWPLQATSTSPLTTPPEKYVVTLAPPLPPDAVAGAYGQRAGELCRPDRKAVQLRVLRLPPLAP